MANGHPDAPHYVVHKVWEETHLVTQRINQQLATEAMLTQMAVSTLLSAQAGREFNKIIERMTDG